MHISLLRELGLLSRLEKQERKRKDGGKERKKKRKEKPTAREAKPKVGGQTINTNLSPQIGFLGQQPRGSFSRGRKPFRGSW